MKASELAKAVAAVSANHAILIYGPPKSGKTRLVGTAAKLPEVENIYWFDLENGFDTILNMGLTEEELDKITVFKIRDTRENPIGVETLLKCMGRGTHSICDMHGKVDCADCRKAGLPFTDFSLAKCTHNDLVVVDTGSQLGESAMAAACMGQSVLFKPGYDEFGIQGKYLSDILSTIQQATFTNFVVVCHALVQEDDDDKEKFFPLMGTKPFSLRVAGKFGTVVFVDKKLNKHVAGSSSTYRGNVVTGSRVGAEIEKAKELTMSAILIDGNILKRGVHSAPAEKNFVEQSTDQVVEVKTTAAPVGLAARLQAQRLAAAARKESST